MHLREELRHVAADLRKIVERDRDEIDLRTIFLMKLYKLREFIAARVAPRRPKVYDHRAVHRPQHLFQARSIDLQNRRADALDRNISLCENSAHCKDEHRKNRKNTSEIHLSLDRKNYPNKRG